MNKMLKTPKNKKKIALLVKYCTISRLLSLTFTILTLVHKWTLACTCIYNVQLITTCPHQRSAACNVLNITSEK